MAKGGGKGDELRPIIIKKIKKGGGGHHGGAWKVAYADFVTAMMAFFLLLWLLNVTSEEQKKGIADYFDPNPRIASVESGANGMLGGLAMSKEGAMVENQQAMSPQQHNPALRPGQDPITDEKLKEEVRKREEANFKKAEEALQKEMDSTAELKDLKKNVVMDMTPEGLRIQIVDQEGKPMFPSGSAEMYERTKSLLEKVAGVIRKMPNEISVRGHTDSVPYSKSGGYGNWELSADRANSSRRVLVQAGFPDKRVNNVLGKADKDHMLADKPNDERNRRISIILLREELVTQVGANMSTEAVKEQNRVRKDPLYHRSSGSVDFP